MTKKEAAQKLFYVAHLIREELEGDDQADVWVLLIEATAHDLDPQNRRYVETYLREPRISKRVKLRHLIEHPATPANEREAAVHALHRLRRSEENPDEIQVAIDELLKETAL